MDKIRQLRKQPLVRLLLHLKNFLALGDIKGQGISGEGFTNFDPQGLAAGSKANFRKFRRALTDEQKMKIFGNESFQAAFGQATAGMNAFSPTQTPEQVLIQSLRAKVNNGTATAAEIAQLNSLLGIVPPATTTSSGK